MSIEERGDEANKRTVFGHWEIDTVVGKKESSSVLLSLDERLTCKRHLVKITSRSSDAVRVGLEKIAELYGESFETVFKSVTSDNNGSEFVDLGEARTKSKTLLSLAFSQRESHWITFCHKRYLKDTHAFYIWVKQFFSKILSSFFLIINAKCSSQHRRHQNNNKFD